MISENKQRNNIAKLVEKEKGALIIPVPSRRPCVG